MVIKYDVFLLVKNVLLPILHGKSEKSVSKRSPKHFTWPFLVFVDKELPAQLYELLHTQLSVTVFIYHTEGNDRCLQQSNGTVIFVRNKY